MNAQPGPSAGAFGCAQEGEISPTLSHSPPFQFTFSKLRLRGSEGLGSCSGVRRLLRPSAGTTMTPVALWHVDAPAPAPPALSPWRPPPSFAAARTPPPRRRSLSSRAECPGPYPQATLLRTPQAASPTPLPLAAVLPSPRPRAANGAVQQRPGPLPFSRFLALSCAEPRRVRYEG